MNQKLPLDPFNPSTLVDADFQLGKLAWAIFLAGGILGIWLILAADWGAIRGWLQIVVGCIVIASAAYFARRLIKSI